MLTPPPLTENLDPLHAKIFSIPEFLSNRGGSPTKLFGRTRQKKLQRRIVIPPPLGIHKIFRYPRFSETPKGSPTNFFRHCETKKFRKNRYALQISYAQPPPPPHPLLCMEISDTRIFLKHKRVPLRIFSALWDKKISKKPLCSPDQLCSPPTPPPPMHGNFRYQNFFETQKGSPTNFFGTVRQKIFDKTVMLSRSVRLSPPPHPLLCMEISDTRVFLKHKRVPQRIFSALWDKKNSTENSDIPFLCIKFFDTRNCLKHRSVPQRNFSVPRQKNLHEVFCIKYRNQWWKWCL